MPVKHRFNILLLILLIFNLPFAAPITASAATTASAGSNSAGSNSQEGAWRKVLVDTADTAAHEALVNTGAQLIVDYDAFSLWQVPESYATQAAARVQMQEVNDGIFLRDVTLLPGKSPLETTTGESLSKSSPEREGEELWLVQFIGPPLPEWLDALTGAGLEIVSYVPNNAYLVWGEQPANLVKKAAQSLPTGIVENSAPYLPVYRLAPALRSLADDPASAAPVDVTVQFFNTPRLESSIAALEQKAEAVLLPPEMLMNTVVARVTLPSGALAEISTWPDVVNIEPYSPPELLDEIQGQILAGNLTQNSQSVQPSSPGYLNWLRGKGFPTLPDAYPLVDLMDDGLDSGDVNNVLHPDFYVYGDKSNPSRVAYMRNCTNDPSGNGIAGHGNLNAGILAGYNNRPEAFFRDEQGYQLGLGISPFGSIASTKLFTNNRKFNVARCYSGTDLWKFAFSPVGAAYRAGALITSNSWGRQTYDEYDVTAQTYDSLTRDATSDTGNQEMLHIFAAGNLGPGARTVSSPGIAKNIITVGATESVRSDGVLDGCNVANGGSANNIAEFSSRGPTYGGRVKPEIVAPGTHIQGPASQVSGYNGIGVCGSGDPEGDSRYYPSGQTLYTWSSGTSHSTPAIAGVAQLAYNYYQRVLQPGKNPSPAMLKALLLNTPRYLEGTGAGDTLPSASQGWGMADMGAMFDSAPRLLMDQENVFSRSGEMVIIENQTSFSSRPLRITLAWTDAPGTPYASRALVNDLDLELIIGGITYRGNVYSKNQSVPGGAADRVNNVESIFLPAGVSGPIEVRVIARSIAGDGVPGNETHADQDFALVIYNSGNGQTVEQPFSYYAPGMIDQADFTTP